MDIQEWVETLTKQTRERNFSNSPQFSLGQLISEIEKIDLKNKKGEYKDVCFDFGTAIPTTLDSWRGSYDELAIGYKLTGYDNEPEHMAEIKANELLLELKGAIGKEYTGWKGGEYTMSENTPVWVANSGNVGNTSIVGVLDTGWGIVLITAYTEY